MLPVSSCRTKSANNLVIGQNSQPYKDTKFQLLWHTFDAIVIDQINQRFPKAVIVTIHLLYGKELDMPVALARAAIGSGIEECEQSFI